MHEFAEEYVVNLQPREERFYTRLGDDFFVATFPNGVKTWVHMYEVNGHTRRQTIGVYPEMPLQKALDALFSARRAQAVDAQLATQGMDNPQVRMTEDSPIDLTAKIQTIKLPRMGRRFLAGALSGGSIVGLVVAVVGWVFVGSGQPTQTPVTAADDSADSVVAVAAEPELVEERKKAPSVAAQVAREVSAATEAPVATVVPAETETKAPDPGKAQRALLQLQEDLAGTLATAQLTSAVENGQPVDNLSWLIELDKQPRRVFYYVRVRGMAGSNLKYNWRFNGNLLKEETVSVGSGWHSPAFSGITLTAERLGNWQVEVVGPDGDALGSEEFETRMRNDALTLSQR